MIWISVFYRLLYLSWAAAWAPVCRRQAVCRLRGRVQLVVWRLVAGARRSAFAGAAAVALAAVVEAVAVSAQAVPASACRRFAGWPSAGPAHVAVVVAAAAGSAPASACRHFAD